MNILSFRVTQCVINVIECIEHDMMSSVNFSKFLLLARKM